jgi:Bacterial mobilisation protein (MobC)
MVCPMSPGTPASQRARLTVDVGPELSARVRAAAAAGGRTPSEWTRELLQRELRQETAQEAVSADTWHQQQSEPDALAAAPGRLALDPELATLLQQIQQQGQFRTRPAALRLVLRHFIGQGATPAAEPIDATPLKNGVAALMRSNHELLPIGKNINQIAKSLNAMQGGFRNTDTQNLQVFAQAVREHVEQAARVVATVRALVTPHKAPQKDKP